MDALGEPEQLLRQFVRGDFDTGTNLFWERLVFEHDQPFVALSLVVLGDEIDSAADLAARLQELPTGNLPAWLPDLEHLAFQGIPAGNESVWFHRPSATLIVTDLLQWMAGDLPWPTRAYATLTGVRRGLAVPWTVRHWCATAPPRRAVQSSCCAGRSPGW